MTAGTITLVGALLGTSIALLVPDRYASQTLLTAKDPSQVPSYVQVAALPEILAEVGESVGTPPERVRESITVSQLVATNIVRIVAEGDSPAEATDRATTLAATLVQRVESLEQVSGDSPDQAPLTVTSPASKGESQMDLSARASIAFGSFLVVSGVGYVVARLTRIGSWRRARH